MTDGSEYPLIFIYAPHIVGVVEGLVVPYVILPLSSTSAI